MSELTNDERDLLDRLLKQSQPTAPAAPVPRQRSPQRPRPKPRTIQPAVKVEPIASPGPATANTRTTILNRRALDVSLPTAKGIGSVLGWGNSVGTGGATGWQIQNIVWLYYHPGQSLDAAPVPWVGALIGVVLQILCSFAQIYTAGRSKWGYMLALAPDVLTTTYQWVRWLLYPWLVAVVAFIIGPESAHWITMLMSCIIGLTVGYYSARLPEYWVFGPRTRKLKGR